MEQNNNGDELFEIKPDVLPEEDQDIRIDTEPAEDRDIRIDTEPAEVKNAASDGVPDREAASADSTGMQQGVNADSADSTGMQQNVNMEPADDFRAELEEMEQEEKDLRMLEEIGDSILEQVDAEIENTIIEVPTSKALAEQLSQTAGHEPAGEEDTETQAAEESAKRSFWRIIPWWGYTVFGIIVLMVGCTIWATATSAGRGTLIKLGSRYAANRVTYMPVEPVEQVDVPDEDDLELISEIDDTEIEQVAEDFAVVTPEFTPTPTAQPSAQTAGSTDDAAGGSATEGQEEMTPEVTQTVYNILLLGEESIDSGGYRGRTDLIMLASINLEQSSVKLISIMRDSLVAIPGYADNRINAAYAIGGVSLLYETLKANLGIEPDNYILVNFESFEKIVDAIGGVDIELTSAEAKYLNTTNYISNPEYRTVVKGLNHLNGNQTLGYCRVRNVGTANHEYSDFGRTARHRAVVNAIYERAEGMNYLGLMSLAGKCLPYVTTDLEADDIENYINMLLRIGVSEGIENYRIPIGGTYSDARIRDMLVTKIDLEKNAQALHEFIYGSTDTQ